jgi:hypothetical protein
VAARFVTDPKINAGAAPFLAMGRNPTTTGPFLGEEMGQLVPKSPINLRVSMRGQPAIEQYARVRVLGPAGGGTQAG